MDTAADTEELAMEDTAKNMEESVSQKDSDAGGGQQILIHSKDTLVDSGEV